MNYYLYNEQCELGKEKLGTEGRWIFNNCTIKKVTNFLKRFPLPHFSLYSFTNFYDNSTFQLIKSQ